MSAPSRDRSPRLRRLHAEEDGLSAGAEALVFGVLVFVVGTIIAINGWVALDAHFAANAAAREAVRAIVDGGAVERTTMVGDGGLDGTIGAGRAYDVAAATMAGHGKDPTDPSFTVILADDPWGGAVGPPQRCARVTVRVRYPVNGISLPIVGGWQTPFDVEGQHTEIIDPFRSGLAGRADCG